MPFHGPELIIIVVIALLIFGPKKLPEMGNAIGKSITQFKRGMSELTDPKEDTMKTPDLEAIEREVASKKAAATDIHSILTPEETSSTFVSSEINHSEIPVE